MEYQTIQGKYSLPIHWDLYKALKILAIDKSNLQDMDIDAYSRWIKINYRKKREAPYFAELRNNGRPILVWTFAVARAHRED